VTVARTFSWIVLLGSLPLAALAHGAGHERLADADTVSLRFAYALGEPMAAARVEVAEPGSTIVQRGQTDADGRFAFVPDRPGEWTVTADDGLGHEVVAPVTVGGAEPAEPAALPVSIPPRWLLYTLLASLAANAGLVSVIVAARRQRTRD